MRGTPVTMHNVQLTTGQLGYLQELVMFGYEMDVAEQKDWDVQTYDNLVDAVMEGVYKQIP